MGEQEDGSAVRERPDVVSFPPQPTRLPRSSTFRLKQFKYGTQALAVGELQDLFKEASQTLSPCVTCLSVGLARKSDRA